MALEKKTLDRKIIGWTSLSGMVLATALLFAPTLAGAQSNANQPAYLMGGATNVIDGSTLVVGGISVRIEGVYTAKPGELYGHTARVYTERAVEGLQLRCELTGATMEGYPVARCISGGRDLGALIVEAGAALDCPAQSNGRFKDLESARARELLSLPPECL